MVVLVQLHLEMIEVGGALRAKVDDYVEDRSPSAAHELGLRRRRILEMHPAQGAFLGVVGDVRLRDHRVEAVLLELVLREGTGEEAPLVLQSLELDHEGAGQIGLLEDHRVRLLSTCWRLLTFGLLCGAAISAPSARRAWPWGSGPGSRDH